MALKRKVENKENDDRPVDIDQQILEQRIKLGNAAAVILEERDAARRRQGGVTPAQLQEWIGRYAELANPGTLPFSTTQILKDVADDWHLDIVMKGGLHDERYYAVVLLHMAMHVASHYAFDLYEMGDDGLEMELTEAVALGDMAHNRLVNKTAGEGQGNG